MKALILAGGSGTRLYPTTEVINKHFLPIYNKPMIYYALSLPLIAGIKDIVLIVNPEDKELYEKLLGDGKKCGINIQYCEQESPKGLSHAVLSARYMLEGNKIMVVLGDNILYGHNLDNLLRKCKAYVEENGGAYIFGYHVHDPERFGIVEFDDEGNVISIEEKPKNPKSNFAVIGVYFFDETAFEKAEKVKPSKRGEYEITSLLEEYLKEGRLKVELLGRGYAWFDAGTYESFLDAGNFIKTIEEKTGYMIGCIEEISFRNGWIDLETLEERGKKLSKTNYGKYLLELVKEEKLSKEGRYAF